jgi:tetratricopeptide (TPR) repeat protein
MIARTAPTPVTEKSAEWYEAQSEIFVDNMVNLQASNPRVYLRAAHIQSILEIGNPLWRSHRDHRLSSMEVAISLDPWVASYAFADAPDLLVIEILEMQITAPRGEYERGRALLSLGNAQVAGEAFARAIEGLESWAPAWFMVGESWRLQGDLSAAMAAYNTSLELSPSNQVMKGWAELWTGSTGSAIVTFTNFLEVNPDHTWATQGLLLARQTTPSGD